MKIDVDGSGPLRPFPVTCEFYGRRSTLYLVRHCRIIRMLATLLGPGGGSCTLWNYRLLSWCMSALGADVPSSIWF